MARAGRRPRAPRAARPPRPPARCSRRGPRWTRRSRSRGRRRPPRRAQPRDPLRVVADDRTVTPSVAAEPRGPARRASASWCRGSRPARVSAPIGRISSPVGSTTTTGARRTASSTAPAAAAAARSTGRSRCPSGSSSSAALMSSPIERTCWYGGTAGRSSALAAGRVVHVLAHDHRVAPGRHRVAGVDDLVGGPARAAAAWSRSRRPCRPARTAMPSIAAASYAGDERRAHTGSAVTRPTRLARPARARRRPGPGSRCGRRGLPPGLRCACVRRGRPRDERAARAHACTLTGKGSPRPRCPRPARWPARGRRGSRRRAVSTESSADGPKSGSATPVAHRDLHHVEPAGGGRQVAARAGPGSVGSAGGVGRTRPSRHTSGTPTSRNTTSADSGLPGSPMTGTGVPPTAHSASSVGLPGLMASPWHQIPAEARDRAGGLVAGADRRAGRDDHEVAPGERLAQRGLQRAGVVGARCRRHRLAAGVGHQAGERRCRRVPHLSRPQVRGRRRHDLVAGGDDRRPAAGRAPRPW